MTHPNRAPAQTPLVPIARRIIRGTPVPVVDAAKLHQVLGVGRDFSNWIKSRISQYGFVRGDDYVTESRSPKLATGNRGRRTEYHLTLDMAKELAMVERNEKGRQARRYFIECERQLREQRQSAVKTTPADDALIHSADYRAKAQQYVTEYFDACRQMLPPGSTLPRLPSDEALGRLADGLLADVLEQQRWLLRFHNGAAQIAPLSRNEFITSWSALPRLLRETTSISTQELGWLLETCARLLAKRSIDQQEEAS